MIVLASILLGLILLTWIYSMYVSWKIAQGVPPLLLEAAPFVARWAQLARLTRRGWYKGMFKTEQVLSWSTTHIKNVFVKIFPNSAPVFTKRDAMTGLTQGPSSYFLKSISTSRKPGNKRLNKTKKMI